MAIAFFVVYEKCKVAIKVFMGVLAVCALIFLVLLSISESDSQRGTTQRDTTQRTDSWSTEKLEAARMTLLGQLGFLPLIALLVVSVCLISILESSYLLLEKYVKKVDIF